MKSAAAQAALFACRSVWHPAKMNPSAPHPSLNTAVSAPSTTKPKPAMTSERLRNVLPAVWELMRPRRGLLALGFVLMVINRVSGLVLPYSTKFLMTASLPNITSNCGAWSRSYCWPPSFRDHVIRTHAIVIEGGAQRLIAELRQRVQATFRTCQSLLRFQQNRHLVSRIMTDVEGGGTAGNRAGRSGRRAALFALRWSCSFASARP
jgi:subfamily B ATP-binding cassette protein MsbA